MSVRDGARRIEDSFTREQLLAANESLVRRLEHVEHGIMQEYVTLAEKMIEGFTQFVIDATEGNLPAKEKVEKFLDALRMAQGKPVKLPRVIETPTGPIMVEAENKSEALPDPDDDGSVDVEPQGPVPFHA